MSTRGPSIAPRTTLALSPAGTGTASSPESASSPGAVTSIVTSREWVLPPRPKPGRKPSVDTPASKRKAQNRAAQRAFRERRATRVQELEQQLLEVEREKELKEMGLVSTINKLKFENLILSKSVEQLRLDFNTFRSSMGAPLAPASAASPASYPFLEKPLQNPTAPYGSATRLSVDENSNAYKADLSQSAQHLLNFAKSLPVNHTTASPALLLYSVQQILPAPSVDSTGVTVARAQTQPVPPAGPITIKAESLHMHASNETNDFDCGVCIKEQCLCEDIGLKSPKSLEETFNTFAPMPAVSLRGKRTKSTEEVDFTAEFSSKKMPDLKRLRRSAPEEKQAHAEEFDESSPVENCGFCSDDTPCVCREAAKEAARIKELSLQQEQIMEDEKNISAEEAGPTLLPPIQVKHPSMMRKASLPVMHPGPTFELREISNMNQSPMPTVVSQEAPLTLKALQPANQDNGDKSGCTGNPGTCSQCQTDPMSTLFCSTVASKAAQQTGPPAQAVPTGRGSDYFNSPHSSMSDCRTTSVPGSTNPSTPNPSTPSGLSNGIFIPCADAYRTLSRHKRFNTIDFLSLVGRLTTRGMQVEVQSVANMIRELDKKVYD
ncbi:hypothetical protein METBIDRAFT_210934 [Metschnikowia bicuspidata var. bicuspidata NRRL YB-4993]|uniref:BZIP domain-containing protein n=1 Tax=Metschnikowia bicuspidata var. bicuspidata NRRL YB-4993 TaxID=869754 RepID=A0A1A0H7M2_9ASCO|nr:hypothetical protein METBIDRAFT_210934 [Metschnikowia bicuspidata var. bicuspidata NRRL YB-4993]OBA19980.1 hypothetical protein METBIDRAFT_210934 [Metschnikowia bicuspidata var. bicuspidata NRRL YB-4993]